LNKASDNFPPPKDPKEETKELLKKAKDGATEENKLNHFKEMR
jgi:hypothetical protein